MKKILSVLVLTGLLAVPAIGLAATCSDYSGESTCASGGCLWDPSTSKCLGTNITDAAGLIDLITTIGNWIFAALLGLAAIFLILAGFYWVTASGNPEGVKKASDMLRFVLIGVAVALGAKGLVAIIGNLIS